MLILLLMRASVGPARSQKLEVARGTGHNCDKVTASELGQLLI